MKRLRLLLMLLSCCWLAACSQNDLADPAPAAGPLTVPERGIYPLRTAQDLDVLLGQIGDARYVLLGEASHGTEEFYTWRATLSRRLIQEKGFTLVAVEGDWPDLYEVNRFVRGAGNGASAEQVLGRFQRWPTWLWANRPVADFANWLRAHNGAQPAARQTGMYGLDVYSLWTSLESLRDSPGTTPATRTAVANALSCLAHGDEQAYMEAVLQGHSCAEAVASVLTAVQAQVGARPADEVALNALQNAQAAVSGERYYRSAARGSNESWNIRDRHMAATIAQLVSFHGPAAKIIVWEHNTHVGDARYTDMADAGMVNVGQLVRQQHGSEGVFLVGFGTYSGTVTAAPAWGGPVTRMTVPPARAGSWEEALHRQEPLNKLILLPEWRANNSLTRRRGHRAIGVQYNPQSEAGNYVPTDLPHRYDAFLFIDQTQALSPLQLSTGGRAAVPAPLAR